MKTFFLFCTGWHQILLSPSIENISLNGSVRKERGPLKTSICCGGEPGVGPWGTVCVGQQIICSRTAGGCKITVYDKLITGTQFSVHG